LHTFRFSVFQSPKSIALSNQVVGVRRPILFLASPWQKSDELLYHLARNNLVFVDCKKAADRKPMPTAEIGLPIPIIPFGPWV
jgi:hypothetical protein